MVIGIIDKALIDVRFLPNPHVCFIERVIVVSAAQIPSVIVHIRDTSAIMNWPSGRFVPFSLRKTNGDRERAGARLIRVPVCAAGPRDRMLILTIRSFRAPRRSPGLPSRQTASESAPCFQNQSPNNDCLPKESFHRGSLLYPDVMCRTDDHTCCFPHPNANASGASLICTISPVSASTAT